MPMKPSLVLVLALFTAACAGRPRATEPHSGTVTPPPGPVREEPGEGWARVLVSGHELRLEVAADWDSRGRGLSGRTAIAEGGGMLFVYPVAASRSFWMKDCLVGLDIAFVDDRLRLIELISLDPPAPGCAHEDIPRARCHLPARYVIETRKGWFADHDLGLGAVVELPAPILELAERGGRDA